MKPNNYREYYINYTKDNIDKKEMTKLIEIYNRTMSNIVNCTDYELHSFITAWHQDAYEEKPYTIGPKFSIAVSYYDNSVNDIINEINLRESWFKEAAIRDYILKLNHKFTYEIKKLKQINLEISYT